MTLPDGSDHVVRDGPRRLGDARARPQAAHPTRTRSTQTTAAGFPEGAVISTDDTIYMGFGFEGISDAATRNAVMGRSMSYLLRP